MKLIKSYLSIIIMGLCVIISGATLMVVSQNVYETQSRIQKMKQDALTAEWDIRALNAELTFLTRPDRLEQITTAMVQSISPASGDGIMVISPASFTSYTPQLYNIIPNRKPAKSLQRVSAPKPQKTTPTKVTKSNDDFSSFLDSIGGNR